MTLYWHTTPSPGRIATMARPRAGDWLDDEIAGWRSEGVDVVVSLLETEEISDLDLGGEAAACQRLEIEYVSFPIPDRGVPESETKAVTLAKALAAHLANGRSVAINCRAGIGRSSMIAALVMRAFEIDHASAFDRISQARGLTVPDTEEQRHWLAQVQWPSTS